MALTFPTPPTFASPVVVNPQTGQNQFNPVWLNWFLVLAQYLETSTTGRVRDIIPVASSGIYEPSNGTNNLLGLLWGGGGPGGSAATTGVGQCSVGGGGGAGAFTFFLLSSEFSGVLLTVGGPGNATTFAAGSGTITAGAGQPGQSGIALTSGFTLGGAGGAASSGVITGTAPAGLMGIALSPTTAASGQGASSGIGQGGLPVTAQGPGNNATGLAAGGSGGLNLASAGATQNGGSGSKGFATLVELS